MPTFFLPPDFDFMPLGGAALLGTYISTMLYGFTTFQTYRYYQLSWTTDTMFLKLYVFIIWILETLHTALSIAFTFRFAIVNYGNLAAFEVTKPSDDAVTFSTAVISFLVHLFYCRRLWILSNNSFVLVGVVLILSFANFGMELATGALTFVHPKLSDFHLITPYYTGSLSLAAAVDIIIAASLSYLLYRHRGMMESTNTIITKITAYAITTGALTTVTNIIILICFVTMPDNLWYLCFYSFIPNLYTNSFLAMLNSRAGLRAETKHVFTSTGVGSDSMHFARRTGISSGTVRVGVDVDVDSASDYAKFGRGQKDASRDDIEMRDV
ncbi:uncharacterized protein BXZ73DRAFT_102163 [Epithele typhae]|uniref:uncharacterized protein n=1 Tax=Epithele typhae TaxID=378194 RepID=UPI00200785FA|nr:uncharacterized protein BXZ73DRAFT_102163 [Epithele typhae]KAH9929007.1 hypothetical protein BXZ73DRAFT_102163 [Epithele typhae]